jgi:hypothetical protein
MNKSAAYPPLDGLLDLACRDGVDIRPTLLRVLTDLYVQKPTHSAEEEAQYVELALGLIEVVDAPTRAAAIASLSAYPGAPAIVLRKLTGSQSPDGGNDPVSTDTKIGDLVDVFFAAGAEERRLILINLDVDAVTAPRRPAAASSEVIRRLEAAALQRNAGEFSRMLERALGIGAALAARITRDPSGEPVVVAARALGMSAAVLQRVLLFLNPEIGQSIARVHDLARLFDELTPQAGERMVAIWRNVGGQAKPVHQPLHWDDERRSPRAPSAPARPRVAADRTEQPSRSKGGGR